MKKRLIWAPLLAALLSAACGGQTDLTCDEVQFYQRAKEGKRVEAPEGLDDLDPLQEMPIPRASAEAARPPGSVCIDRPPQVDLGTD